MKYKLLIVSSDPTILSWSSLESKKKAILNALNKTPNGEWEIEIRQQTLAPKIVDNRIEHQWYNDFSYPLFRAGYHFIYLHFSKKQWEELKLDRKLRGVNQIDTDFVGESYGWGDENTLRGQTRQNQFVQNSLHEMSHELARTTNVTDLTHPYHNKNKDISGIFVNYDMANWQPVYQTGMKKVGLLTKIIELTKQLININKPVEKPAVVLARPDKLTPLVERKANEIVALMEKRGMPVRVVEGFRSVQKQDELYAQGRTKPGAIVTTARGGESFHNYGVAVDFVFRKEGYNATQKQWEILGKVGESVGFEWGGRWTKFVDRPHFEMKLGYTLNDFQQNKVDWKRFQ